MSILKRRPVDGPITQLFGQRPEAYARFGLLGHNGIDFGIPIGTPVIAPADGAAVEVADDPGGYGLYIKVRAEWGEYLVAHLSRRDVAQGANVLAGQRLGESGNTGNSTGPHLHFGMRISPYDRKDGQAANELSWGGYSDPKPYLDQIGVEQDLLGVQFIGRAAPTLADVRRMQPTVCLFVEPNRDDVVAFRAACPNTATVGRIYRPDSEVGDRIRANPLEAARWAHDLVMAHPARDQIDYWQSVVNEVCQVGWEEFQQLVTFERERMRLADASGYKCAIFAFSVGNPDLPQNDHMGFWRATYPALDYAEARGHVLLLHQYGCCPDIWGPEERGGSPWFIHRWEVQVRPYLRQRRLRVVVGEFGYDGLIQRASRGPTKTRDLFSEERSRTADSNPGWKTAMSAEEYAGQLRSVAGWLERYSGQVLGYTIFQAGDGDAWKNYDITGEVLQRLASDQPTPPDPPDPPDPPGNEHEMRLGKGIVNQGMTVIPFDQRTDFNPAAMTPDSVVWRLIDAFTTHDGSWEPNADDQWAIDQWARDSYHFPPNDPRYNQQGGGGTHLQVCVQDVQGQRIPGAGTLYTSDGPQWLQRPDSQGHVVQRNTEASGWANIPITGSGSMSRPPAPGPWSMTKYGMSDILTGAGLPWNNHVTTFGVWQAVRYGDLQPAYATLEEALYGEAQAHQVIEFNPKAALQKRIFADGFVPNSPEFELLFDEVTYVGQRAEHLGTGKVRTYYCATGDWANVEHIEW